MQRETAGAFDDGGREVVAGLEVGEAAPDQGRDRAGRQRTELAGGDGVVAGEVGERAVPVRVLDGVGGPGRDHDDDPGGQAPTRERAQDVEGRGVGAVGVVEGQEQGRVAGEAPELVVQPRAEVAVRDRAADAEVGDHLVPRRGGRGVLAPGRRRGPRPAGAGGVDDGAQHRGLPRAGAAVQDDHAAVVVQRVEDRARDGLAPDDVRAGRAGARRPAGDQRAVERAQLRPGLDVELVAQPAPHLEVGLDGVAGPAAVAQRAHEQGGELLVEAGPRRRGGRRRRPAAGGRAAASRGGR